MPLNTHPHARPHTCTHVHTQTLSLLIPPSKAEGLWTKTGPLLQPYSTLSQEHRPTTSLEHRKDPKQHVGRPRPAPPPPSQSCSVGWYSQMGVPKLTAIAAPQTLTKCKFSGPSPDLLSHTLWMVGPAMCH